MSERVPYRLAQDTYGPEELYAMHAVWESGRLTMGERVREFEEVFATYVGAEQAIMVNSGSSANLLMVDACLRRSSAPAVLQKGDEVLVAALGWPTTVWPLVQLGLVPVFVDVDPDTLALDLSSAESVMGPRTKGMFLTHVLGQAAALEPYLRFCRQRGLVLLEDACESLGAHGGRPHVGTAGIMGSFSFYYSHHLSTIEGGMVVTDDPALADDLRSLRAHGWVRDRRDREDWEHQPFDDRFLFVMPGYNVRPMEMQGALGSVQLLKLETSLDAREELARLVASWAPSWLELLGARHLVPNDSVPRQHSWMTLPFRLRERAPCSLPLLLDHLDAHGVETRPIIAGNLARHPAMALITYRQAASLRTADELLHRGFMIGCHPSPADGALDTLREAMESLERLS